MHDTRSFQATVSFVWNAQLRQENLTLTKSKAWDLSPETGSNEDDHLSSIAGQLPARRVATQVFLATNQPSKEKSCCGEERRGGASTQDSKTQNALGSQFLHSGL